jgi:hypothetical protein
MDKLTNIKNLTPFFALSVALMIKQMPLYLLETLCDEEMFLATN